MDSCHSCPQPHPCQNQTAEGCTSAGNCPVSKKHTFTWMFAYGKTRLFSIMATLKWFCLTLSSVMPSLSSSGSQASPCPSASRSSCPEFGSMGQLSCSQSQQRLMVCSSGISQQVWMILAHAEVDILPFHSDRWHSACRVIYYWASHPDQSPHHTGSHRQQTPPHTHTCTRPQTPGQGIYTQHTCGKCVCCLCKGCTVHTPTNRAALWESKSLYG